MLNGVTVAVVGNNSNDPWLGTVAYGYPPTGDIAPVPVAAVARRGLDRATIATFATNTFVDQDPESLARIPAVISCGDGTSSPGSVVRNGGRFDLVGSHTYAIPGIYSISATVDVNPAVGRISIASTATVEDQPIADVSPGGPITGAVAGAGFTLPIAAFSVGPIADGPPTHQAIIDWGDGTSSPGELVASGSPAATYAVRGSHTYARPGSCTPVVTIRNTASPRGSVGTAARTLQVGDSAVSPLEGQSILAVRNQPFTRVIATFSSPNPLASPSQSVATIDWGDRSTPSAGLITRRGDGIFEVSGTHTYGESTEPIVGPAGPAQPPADPPQPASIEVREVGGTTPLLLSVARRVLDAPIVAEGAAVTGAEGSPLRQSLLATFRYDGGPAPPDQFFARVTWGDGTAEVLAPGSIVQVGGTESSPVFAVSAQHAYAARGLYPIQIEVATYRQSRAIASSTAAIAPSLTIEIPELATSIGAEIRDAAVASFVDRDGGGKPAAAYRATINWGDGTTTTAAVVRTGASDYAVLGTHRYTSPGQFHLAVSVVDDLNRGAQEVRAISVLPGPIPLSGALDRASDSGVSALDGITNVGRPAFSGIAPPQALVALYSRPIGSAAEPILRGQARADAGGGWRITSSSLPDGAYTLFVTAGSGDPGQQAVTPIEVGIGGRVLVIDTVGPRVTETRFFPLGGRVRTTFQDDRSGLAQAGLTGPANYSIARERTATGGRNPRNAPRFAVTGVATTADLDPAAPRAVGVTIDNNREITGGSFRYIVRAAGITDVAGNPLAGSFPTGGSAGTDFAAELISSGRRVLPVLPAAASVADLTPAGQRQLGSIIAAVDSGRLAPGRAATRIAALPRRGDESARAIPIAKTAKPTARVADRLLRRGSSPGN